MTGGGSRLVGFLDRLAQQFRIPVVPGSCLQRIDCSRLAMTPDNLGKIDPLAAVAVGLALPEPVQGTKPFNLIPPELAIKARQVKTERAVVGVGVLLVVVFVALGVFRFLQVHSAEGSVNNLNGQIAALSAQEATYNRAANQRTEILDDGRLALPLVSDEMNWPAVIQTLMTSTPKDLQVTSFNGTSDASRVYSSGTQVFLTPPSNPQELPGINNVLGLVTLSVVGNTYLSFRDWVNAYQNKPSGPPSAGDFIIVSDSSISADQTTKAISFTSGLAVSGAIHTSRFNEYEVKTK